VRGLEGLEELLEHLLLGFLAGDDIGVLETGVDSLDVIVVEVAIAVLVHDGEGFGDNCFTVGVHGPADGAEELIVLDQTVAVAVEEAEELLDFALGEAKTEVCHALAELIFVQGHGVVIVHDSELTTQADDATGTTRCKLLAELLDQHVGGDSLLGGGSASNSVTEEVGGELTVGDNTRLIVIINAEESVEVLSGRDHDSDLLDGLGEFFGAQVTAVVDVEEFEGLEKGSLLRLDASSLLRELGFEVFLETIKEQR